MVVLNRIYTRSGDDGTTALGTGERRKKYDLRIEAYGTLDEVNAVIGLARLHVADDRLLDQVLARSDILILCTPHAAYANVDLKGKPVVDVWGFLKNANVVY